MTTPNPKAKTDPTKNTARAWQIALNPGNYSKSERSLLIKRGIIQYTSGETLNQEQLLTDVSEFTTEALKRKTKAEVVSNPPAHIAYPGKTALLMALGSVLVRRHPVITNDPRKPTVHKHVREYYLNSIYAAAKHSDYSTDIRVTIGEVVYSRDAEDEYGPPVGRPVEGITQLENLPGAYYKIPLTHANRKCASRENNDEQAPLNCVIKGPYVFIPANNVHDKYTEYFNGYNGVAALLEQVIEKTVSEERLEAYQNSLSGVNKRIEELSSGGHDDMLFKERRYPAKLEVILRSVESVDEDIAKLGEQLTASEIHNAVRDYATWTETDWVQNIAEQMNSAGTVANLLSNYANNDDLAHVTVIKRDGKPDLYELEYMVGNFKQIEVTEIKDLLEFPCMENLHKSLLQKKPVRWELYSFVRYLFEVDNVEFTIEDIQEWFSQYDWHRPDVTEYQVGYEKRQRMPDGERPLPISCNNDNRNWGEHCIGKENCSYSLYRSIDLKSDVYNRAGE